METVITGAPSPNMPKGPSSSVTLLTTVPQHTQFSYLGRPSSEQDGMVTRSVSAPHLQQPVSEQLVQGLEDLQRFRRWDQTLRNLHKMSRASWSEHRECPVSVVEQIFTFVAGSPDEAVRKFWYFTFLTFHSILVTLLTDVSLSLYCSLLYSIIPLGTLLYPWVLYYILGYSIISLGTL